jgi:hypothetical protein
MEIVPLADAGRPGRDAIADRAERRRRHWNSSVTESAWMKNNEKICSETHAVPWGHSADGNRRPDSVCIPPRMVDGG